MLNDILSAIEFIDTKKAYHSTRMPMNANTISLSKNGVKGRFSAVRFSPLLVNLLRDYSSVSIARNKLTNEIFIIFFKDDRGTNTFRIDNHKNQSYPVINSVGFAESLASILKIENKEKTIRLKISDNLANDLECATFKIMQLL